MLTNLVKKTIPVVALVLATSATVCLADTKGKTKRQPANAQTNYYHEKVGNSDIQIQWAPVGKPPSWNEP
jgi:hypothetical protein